MKTSRPPKPPHSPWWRVAGYGGALLLVAAAVAVLVVPVVRGNGGRVGAAATPGPGQAGATTVPPSANPGGNPVPQQQPSGQLYPSATPSATPGGQGGGGPEMPLPRQNGGGTNVDWCDQNAALYRPAATGGGVEVVVNVAASSAVTVEVTLTGGTRKSKQDTVLKGAPRTFAFPDVAITALSRAKVTTLALGGTMGSCYARPGA
ncbi:hypothetical protein BTM25_43590 [Actinomadura rubteroloni]|uniref:Uncharacterized protein n=1 Tax=Actinomadura rubteroloni TaxID=1926885 RepID=A0A2P4UDT1_9ACTN|nr:hypothetical protein [Actinomadura rubteroloni]POM23207.1 hypothetical protein BTM25_43590 [Actinomadura rubteroloni]